MNSNRQRAFGQGAEASSSWTRFLTDTSLEHLARKLRLLGYDVVTIRGARLEELLEAARRERRIVLTQSARHPARYADVAVITVPRGDPGPALRLLVAMHAPAGEPFSRCMVCNEPLQRRTAFEARGEVPGRVLRTARGLTYCPQCGRWYWEGSHVDRLRAWLEGTLGRPLPRRDPSEENG